MEQENYLNCEKCSFRFNSIIRKPVLLPCGDSICIVCSKKLNKCCICFKVIGPEVNYPINKKLMRNVKLKKDHYDMVVNICFTGSTSVGKSSLIKALSGQPFLQHIGSDSAIDFKQCDKHVKGMNLRYRLWDTETQQKYQFICKTYYRNVDFVILVYDLSVKATQNNVMAWIKEAIFHTSENVSIIMVGNKKDLINQTVVNRPIEKTTWQFIQQRYPHIQLSCKTNFGLSELWDLIDQNIVKSGKKPNPTQTRNIQNGNHISPNKLQKSKIQNSRLQILKTKTCF